jgi:glucose/arabinose dehydrogenase
MRSLRIASLVLVAAAVAWPARAADPAVKTEVVLSGLDNPSGVAVHARGDVFVADSGAGQVVRVNPQSAGKAVPVITGFPLDVYGKGPMFNIGPLGLVFLNPATLVVGGGDQKDGSELIRFYAVPESGKSIPFDQVKHQVGPIGPGEESKLGEGNFYALAASKTALFATSNGDDTKGWVVKTDLSDNTPAGLKPFIATKVAVEVDAPVGITFAADGNLVVGQMGEINVPTDSLLTVYDPATGKLLWKATTGLFDIAALAYSPKTGKLYALDFAWMDTKLGGLFRLDVTKTDGGATVKAEKVASLDKPTAMAFGNDGTLYVTVFGTAAEGSTAKPGQLLKITGGL